MVVVGDGDREVGAHGLAHAAHSLGVGLWVFVADHGSVQGQEQAVDAGGFPEFPDDAAGELFIRFPGDRARRGGLGSYERVQFVAEFFSPGDVPGDFVKGAGKLLDDLSAGEDGEVVQRGWLTSEGVGFVHESGDGDAHEIFLLAMEWRENPKGVTGRCFEKSIL